MASSVGPDKDVNAEQTVNALGATTAALWSQLSELRVQLGAASDRIGELERQRDEVGAILDQQRGRHDAMDLQGSHSAIKSWLWISHSPLNSQPLISVVLPTFTAKRATMLRGAIESVLNQSYDNWELLVVDNSDEPMLSPAPEWWPDDLRIRILRSAPYQPGSARNTGLDAAAGELIAYLDDDCRWFPWWLHSAVAAFEASPDSAFVHGIRFSGGSSLAPLLVQAERVTPISLHVDNHVDTNTLVHRSDIDERWDEELSACTDYDLIVRLASRPHVLVPVPACAYGVSAPERVWDGTNHLRNIDQRNLVRARARSRRPLRVVAFNAFYPLITETYIGDELEALRRCGVDVVLARSSVGPAECPSTIDVPLYESLGEAIDAHDPDLVLAHWGNTAKGARELTNAMDIPHAVRLHSMCETIPTEEIFDDWCIGGWGPPHVDRGHERSFSLPTLIVDPEPTPSRDERGNNLLSVSAGLPKKGWQTMIDAAALTGAPIDVVMGITTGWEDQADVVRKMMSEAGLADRVQTNLDYGVVQQMFRSAGAVVYSIVPGQPVGQPRSVIEAALAAAPLVVPDATALKTMLGDVGHYYERGNVDSLQAAMVEALKHPRSFEARTAVADQIRHDHSRHELFEEWTLNLTAALVAWQNNHDRDEVWAQRQWWMRR